MRQAIKLLVNERKCEMWQNFKNLPYSKQEIVIDQLMKNPKCVWSREKVKELLREINPRMMQSIMGTHVSFWFHPDEVDGLGKRFNKEKQDKE
jgi:hypothetical protein